MRRQDEGGQGGESSRRRVTSRAGTQQTTDEEQGKGAAGRNLARGELYLAGRGKTWKNQEKGDRRGKPRRGRGDARMVEHDMREWKRGWWVDRAEKSSELKQNRKWHSFVLWMTLMTRP